MLCQQPVQQEQAEGDEDDYLGDGDVRRVLAPHPGQDMQLMPSFIIVQHCQPLFTCLHVCAGDSPPEELLDVRGDGDEHLAADQLPRARLQQLLRQPHPLRAPLPAIPHRIQARLHLLLHTSVH